MLPYFGKAVVSDSGLCSTPDMTYPNWSRKLARDPASGILHLAYTASNMVCYKQSSDGGANWSTPETVGPGMYPAVVSLGWNGVPGSGPWVVYLTPEGSIIRAIRMSPGSWNQAVVFLATEQVRAGAPSAYADYVAIPYVNVYVAYPVDSVSSPTSYSSICFNVVTQASVSPRELVDGPFPSPVSCYGASVVANPAAGIHVCWIRGQRVYYSQRTLFTPWTFPAPISSPVPSYITEPASNPSMEAWGDFVYCVWRGPNTNGVFPGDVWQRAKYVGSVIWDPTTYDRSQSPGLESDFPVMGTDRATFWHEEVTAVNYDPWVAYDGLPPHYLFQTPQMSRYTHVYCYSPTLNIFQCDAVWTEQIPVTPPLYEVRFGVVTWPPGPSLGNGREIASYYEAKVGQPTPSPYCLSRGGYGDFDSWKSDTSGTVLSYQLPYLDPRMVYKLRAILYHKGKESWDADIRCDSGPWHRIRVGQNAPDTCWLQVPKALYKDGRIVVDVARASGDYVALAGLKLYQLEPEPDGREGVQSAAGVLRTRMLNCVPNPFSRMATVGYELGQAGSVVLTVHDVSGRLVRRLESGYRSPGKYEVSWNATDDHGRRMPAGIYFLRFSAGGQASSRRVTLMR
jgi:hypothetical protein